jgi:hypothetical protein
MEHWTVAFDRVIGKIVAPPVVNVVEYVEGVCMDCHDHCGGIIEDDGQTYSDCCGATISYEGGGYDEDHGKER